jgi:hypothetical protein
MVRLLAKNVFRALEFLIRNPRSSAVHALAEDHAGSVKDHC